MSVFGALYVTGGNTPQVLAHNVEGKVTCWTGAGPSSETEPSTANDGIRINVAGVYTITVNVSHDGDNTKTFHFSVHVTHPDGSTEEIPGSVIMRHQKSAELTGGSAVCNALLGVGDVVELWGECLESAASVTIKEGSMMVIRR